MHDRSAAAKRGWENRRRREAQAAEMPDYGAPAAKRAQPSDTDARGYELPTMLLSIAGNAAAWEDPLFLEDRDAYLKLLTAVPLHRSLSKLGIRTARLDWIAMGPDPEAEADDMRDQLQDCIDQAHFWTDMIRDLTPARVTGWVAMQITKAEGRTEGLIVPDFRNGRLHKWAVSGPHVGTAHYDGKRLIEVQAATGVEHREPTVLDVEPFTNYMLHKPGTSSSGEGDLTTAFTLYPLAKAAHEAILNLRKYMVLYGLPLAMMSKNVDKMTPGAVAGVLRNSAELLRDALEEQGTFAGMLGDIIQLIEPRGQGFRDIMEYMRWLESVSDQILLGNTLTSSVQDAERTGNTKVHMAEEDDQVWFNATQIAETLNRYLVPWIARHNDWDLTGYYIWPAPMGSRGREMADDGMSPNVSDVEEPENDPAQNVDAMAYAHEVLASVRMGQMLPATAGMLIQDAMPDKDAKWIAELVASANDDQGQS